MGEWESARLCLRLGRSKGGIDPMCLRQLRSKALRDGRDIVPMVQWESDHLCLRLGKIYAVRENVGIGTMCLRQLRSKSTREVWNIAPRCQ